jgi:hypothetical protein
LDPELKNKKETEEIKFDLRSRPNNKILLQKNEEIEIDDKKKKKKCC